MDSIEQTGDTMGTATAAKAGKSGTAGVGTAGAAFGALSLVSTLFGAYGQMQAGKANKKLAERNAAVASYQAEDAIARGDVAAQRRLTQARQMEGTQRASLASQGVEVNSGSAADVQADTAYLGALDAVTLQNNAAREAWGYKVQAQDLTLQGKYAQLTGNQAAASTIMTGSSNLLLAKAGFGRSAMATDPLFTRS